MFVNLHSQKTHLISANVQIRFCQKFVPCRS